MQQRRSQQSRQDRDAAEKRRREIDKFLAQSMASRIVIKTSKSSPGNSDRREQRRNGGLYYIAYGQRVSDVYAQLQHLGRGQVSQLPDNDQRWDVSILAPQTQIKELSSAFLAHMGWAARETTGTASGFRLVASGTSPASPPAAPQATGQNRRSWKVPAGPLSQMAGFLEARTRVPVVADAAVSDRRPATNADSIDIVMGGRPEELVQSVAAQYGVGVKPEDLPVTRTLVYYPKSISKLQLKIWENSVQAGQ